MNIGINKYLTMLLEQNKVEVLSIALKLKLFMYLEEENMDFEKLLSYLNTNKDNTQILLEALSMMDLIKKEKGFYINSPLAKKYFVYNTSSYCGDVFLHRKELSTHSRKAMLKLISEGSAKQALAKNSKLWANASKKSLKQEQKNLISKTVLKIVQEIQDFPKMKKMLDLGCSSGVLGLEIINKYPNLSGVLFDFPDLAEVVKEHISEYNLDNRVKFVGGDIQNDEIGSNYDFIWCSNIFYFFENKDEVLEKIYKALNPNGILISAHVEIGEEKEQYEDSFFYFLGLKLQGRTTFKPMHLSQAFEKVGFRNINSYTTKQFPLTKTQIHIVRK
ncbi:methyltransferase [Halarcobacter sp.]|uniref:methyltransferase n=1 Tax=Halarcobacter sp. TaxID=2321133 RepID=UPI003B0036E3